MMKIVKMTLSMLYSILRRIITPFSDGIYSSYDEASAACSKGYQSQDIVKVVIAKNIIYKDQITTYPLFEMGALRTLVGLGLARDGGNINVIDFGGGGYHFNIARIALGASCKIKWNIVETKAMVQEGKRISDEDLKFFDNLDEAKADLGRVDLVFTSGSIQ
jgi:putative methyltransferase (TIGR04325 family)